MFSHKYLHFIKDKPVSIAKIVCILTGVFIILVGVWLWLNNESATGVLGPGKYGKMSPSTLTGMQVVIVGVLFSIVTGLAFWQARKNEKDKKS